MSKQKTIGFIGTGTIADALIQAFCQNDACSYQFILSPRNETTAKKICKNYPAHAKIADSMQEVIDRSEWIFLTLPSSAGEEVCSSLTFSPEKKVVSLMTGIDLPAISNWIGKTAILTHIVPLPFVAFQRGPVILYPRNEEVCDLISPIGNVVAVDDYHSVSVLSAITACPAAYFGLEQAIADWASAHGVPQTAAESYTNHVFLTLSSFAGSYHEMNLEELANDMVPGGRNYTFKKHILQKDAFAPWPEAMEMILSIIRDTSP